MLLAIHVLGLLTAAAIGVIMMRAWHRSRSPMQLSVGLCFSLLSFVNALLIVDRIQGPPFEFVTLRLIVNVLAIGILLYGILIQER